MRHDDTLRAEVNVDVEVRCAETGDLIDRHERHNLFVDMGLEVLADALAGTGTYSGEGNVTHMAVGTDNTAVVAGDDALGAEVFRGALTKVSRSGTGGVVCELYLTSVQGNGSTLREAGLFNGDGLASPNDAMFARVTHPPITKTSSITVTYRWTITLSAA